MLSNSHRDSLNISFIKKLLLKIERMNLKIETAPMSDTNMPFDQAKMYVLFCDYNGHKDWRLPTRDEWTALFGVKSPVLVWLKEEDNLVWDKDWYVRPVRDIR